MPIARLCVTTTSFVEISQPKEIQMKLSKTVGAVFAVAGTLFTAGLASALDTMSMAILGKCIDDPGGNVSDGTHVNMFSCNKGANQEWFIESDGTIRPSADSNMCLDLPAWQTADGTLLELWDCNGQQNQQWTFESDGTLRGYGGKCVEDPGFQTANGTALDYWDCNGGTNQIFSKGDVEFCTYQDFLSCQDFEMIGRGQWLRIEGSPGSEAECGLSCTYACTGGNYGACPPGVQ